MTRLVIHGAAGRMGRRLIAQAAETEGLSLAAAVEAPGHERIGSDAGTLAGIEPIGVPLTDRLPAAGQADVVIDFTTPAALRPLLPAVSAAKLGLVIGTTGLGDDDHAAIDAAGAEIPIVQAPNMSLGVNLLLDLAAKVAATLGEDYDIEITETHHRFKKDAPSGTAMGLAEAICHATGRDTGRDLVHGRHGAEATRMRGEIGMHALRSGDVVGRHTISYATLGEELQLTHLATNRDIFARGALRAAAWLTGRAAGRYGMKDVLGLENG